MGSSSPPGGDGAAQLRVRREHFMVAMTMTPRACGVSGHGIMHAPAVGCALEELTLHGAFQSLDLWRLSLRRMREDAPYPELGIW